MADTNKIICKYIYNNWILSYKSQRAFGLDHGVEESIIRKIKNTALNKENSNYNIPVNTLSKICEAKNLKLYDFFKLLHI